jgi:hypothetical protein
VETGEDDTNENNKKGAQNYSFEVLVKEKVGNKEEQSS